MDDAAEQQSLFEAFEVGYGRSQATHLNSLHQVGSTVGEGLGGYIPLRHFRERHAYRKGKIRAAIGQMASRLWLTVALCASGNVYVAAYRHTHLFKTASWGADVTVWTNELLMSVWQ